MEFISEPISPLAGTFDTRAMSRGEPGLPAGFTRRGEPLRVVEVLQAWKESSREGGVGELYLRRHYYRLRMSNGAAWIVYFIRQSPTGANPRARWFLYGINSATEENAPSFDQSHSALFRPSPNESAEASTDRS